MWHTLVLDELPLQILGTRAMGVIPRFHGTRRVQNMGLGGFPEKEMDFVKIGRVFSI